MREALHHVLVAAPLPAPVSDVALWRARDAEVRRRFAPAIEHAFVAGFEMDRLGWAFASGYQAAGRALFGDDMGDALGALCATEDGGAHPRAIATTLHASDDGSLVLDGHKTYVTLGTHAEVLHVVASEGLGPDGRPRLVVVRIERTRAGVHVTPLPPTPFVPEIPHARLELRAVAVSPDDILPGDGYTRYLKPFRTVEDLHVHAALLGQLIQLARRADLRSSVERLAALAGCASTLAAAEASAPETHVALGGLLALTRAELDAIAPAWERVDSETRTRWERDRALVEVAARARAARLASAWERLGSLAPAEG